MSRPSCLLILRRVRRLRLAFFALALFASASVFARETDRSPAPGDDEARRRTQQIREARQLIDDLPLTPWREAAYLLVELTPQEDGSTAVEVAEKDRAKLPAVRPGDPVRETVWSLPDRSRIFLRVDYFGVVQEIACSVPRKLRETKVTLGVFQVSEDHVECFVREAAPLGRR